MMPLQPQKFRGVADIYEDQKQVVEDVHGRKRLARVVTAEKLKGEEKFIFDEKSSGHVDIIVTETSKDALWSEGDHHIVEENMTYYLKDGTKMFTPIKFAYDAHIDHFNGTNDSFKDIYSEHNMESFHSLNDLSDPSRAENLKWERKAYYDNLRQFEENSLEIAKQKMKEAEAEAERLRLEELKIKDARLVREMKERERTSHMSYRVNEGCLTPLFKLFLCEPCGGIHTTYGNTGDSVKVNAQVSRDPSNIVDDQQYQQKIDDLYTFKPLPVVNVDAKFDTSIYESKLVVEGSYGSSQPRQVVEEIREVSNYVVRESSVPQSKVIRVNI